MAKRMCELCQQKLTYDMRFGVYMCQTCLESYNRALSGNAEAINRFSDPQNFPNASARAKSDVISIAARTKPRTAISQNASKSSPLITFIKPVVNNTPPVVNNTPPVTYNRPDNSESLLDELYENIGKKIKNWAKWIFVLETAAAIISGLGLFFAGEDPWLIGLLLIFVGPLIALVSTWLLYGFGELIEKTAANEQNTHQILKIMSDNNKKE